MRKICFFLPTCFFAFFYSAVAQEIPIALNPATTNQMSLQTLPDGSYQVTTTGADPYVSAFTLPAYDYQKKYIIAFDYQAVNGSGAYGIDDVQIFYGPPISATNRVLLGRQDSSTTWKAVSANMKIKALNWNQAYTQFRFDLGISANQIIKIRNIVLREPTADEIAAENLVTDIPLSLNLSAKNQLNASQNADGSYTLQTLGTDPYIFSNNVNAVYDFEKTYYISFDYLAASGLDDLEIFFGPPIVSTQSVKAGSLPATSIYKTFSVNMTTNTNWKQRFTQFRFDFGRVTGQNIQVKNIRLRNPTQEELDKDPIVQNINFTQYLNASYPNQINTVKVDSARVYIGGTLTANTGNLYLCELKMYDQIYVKRDFETAIPIAAGATRVDVQQDRFVGTASTYDRLYSRWVIAEKSGAEYILKSFAHYPTDISEIAKWNLPEKKPSSKKGVGGFVSTGGGAADLIDLKLDNVTINVVLSSLISLSPTALSYNFNGTTYYFNPTSVAGFDNTFKACAANKTMVSLILLIPRAGSAALQSIFVHPDANNGPYSMANVTSLTGTNYYAACVAFLAERYYRPDQQYGKIDHWIIHNEVDAGYYWTNAGKKPVSIYTELYDRSMRTVYYTARRFNPAAKVFISLTHHWSSSEDTDFYAPKDMLNLLTSMSAKQGDYEWGVAYHPYPADLREPKTWLDASVNNNLNTSPLITPKNIELIDTWMRLKSSLFQGLKVRTLLFSEQGINSKTYSQTDLNNQAAGVAYMWKKFNRLPTLEGIQHHRRVDHSGEGGLLLGLWTTKPSTVEVQDYRKPSWYVWQAANTAAEDATFAFALPIIGVTDWAQTHNPVTGEVMPQKVDFSLTNNGTQANDIRINFNGEFHVTDEGGKAVFYNVASLPASRYGRLTKNKQLIWPEIPLLINQDQSIGQNLAPVNELGGTAIFATQIKITWNDLVDFEKGFVIEAREESNPVFSIIDTVLTNAVSYVHKKLSPGKNYVYRLYAYNDFVKTIYSSEIKVATNMLKPPPSMVLVNDQGICGAAATWTAATLADNNPDLTVASQDHQSGDVFPVGVTTVNFTILDGQQNTTAGSFSVTVTDEEAPVARTKPVSVQLINGQAILTADEVNNNSTDNCAIQSLVISKTDFDCSNIGIHTVTFTITDVHGHVSTAHEEVTVVGEIPAISIVPIPANTTYTGGVPTNIYLGYGPQRISLEVNAPWSGAPYTYSWTGNGILNSTTAQAPVFAPDAEGYYTFEVIVSNTFGCTSSSSIGICVKDIRSPGHPSKVYVYHVPPGNSTNGRALAISVSAVAQHLKEHSGDRLGMDDQPPCAVSRPSASNARVGANDELNQIEEKTDQELKFAFYPNPFNKHATVSLSSPAAEQKVSIAVYDVRGIKVKQLYEGKIEAGATYDFGLEGTNLSPGIYIVHLTTSKTIKTIKISMTE
jgi:Family of unknown function (DUF5722)/Secretion system C-terminal sorting domain/HYR domain